MSLARRPQENLKPKDWVQAAHVEFQQQIVTFLLSAYAFLLVATIGIILLQGFHAWEFNLDAGLLRWLGAATVGEIGGLLLLTFRAVFRS